MRAYIPVVFAFLSCSSSPYALVYWIPAQTMAPTARSAPREIATVAIVIILVLNEALPSSRKPGLIQILVSFQQSLRNCAALISGSILQAP
jgi:hypothetical protein